MKEYLGLCLQGQKSIPERKKMLDEKKRALLSLIQELDDCVAYIDWKQDFYDKVVSGQIHTFERVCRLIFCIKTFRYKPLKQTEILLAR